MISRSSIPKKISKGGKMPQGPGTYGSKKGRPPKKKNKIIQTPEVEWAQ